MSLALPPDNQLLRSGDSRRELYNEHSFIGLSGQTA
jgi:hypothetical protein